MVDERLVLSRLAELTERLDRAERFAAEPTSNETAEQRRDRHELVAFNFLQAAQTSLDLATHWISDAGWAVPKSARECFMLLADRGIVSRDVAVQAARVMGARNLIAHAYGSLDADRLLLELPAGIAAMRSLSRALVGRLEGC